MSQRTKLQPHTPFHRNASSRPSQQNCKYLRAGAYLLPVIHSHPQRANEFLVARELGSDNRKNVPVVLLHDGEHEQGFLLQSCTELEERGLLILQPHGNRQVSRKKPQRGAARGQRGQPLSRGACFSSANAFVVWFVPQASTFTHEFNPQIAQFNQESDTNRYQLLNFLHLHANSPPLQKEANLTGSIIPDTKPILSLSSTPRNAIKANMNVFSFCGCRICTETILTHFTAAFNKLQQQISQHYSESVSLLEENRGTVGFMRQLHTRMKPKETGK